MTLAVADGGAGGREASWVLDGWGDEPSVVRGLMQNPSHAVFEPRHTECRVTTSVEHFPSSHYRWSEM